LGGQDRLDGVRASTVRLSPSAYLKLTRSPDTFGIRHFNRFFSPNPPVHYAEILSAGLPSLQTFVMWDAGRKEWVEVEEEDIP
jgi:hypothetical protein